MAKQLSLLTFAIFVGLLNAVASINWCDVKCLREGKLYEHTMCIYKNNKPAAKCNKVLKLGLDQAEIANILDYHNKIRRTVADLPPLVWDNTLATVAQRWANQCDHKHHDDCRNVGNGDHESAGQNIGWKWVSGGNVVLQEIMSRWVEERQFVNRNMLNSFPKETNHKIGHYTQVVWAKTTRIGCGFVKYAEKMFSTKNNKFMDGYSNFLVCNYGRSGNIPGQRVY